jgi:hypothetical protein
LTTKYSILNLRTVAYYTDSTEVRCHWKGLLNMFPLYVCRDNVVGIATRYELDGPGIDPWWGEGGGRDFPHPSKPAVVPTRSPVWWIPRLFLGCKAVGVWR